MPTPANPSPTPNHNPANEPESRAAAERIAPEMARMVGAELLQINLDIPASVTQLLGIWPTFKERIPAIAALPNVDVQSIEKLRDYALTLHHWSGAVLYVSPETDALPALIEKGIALRDRTLNDLKSLAGHGVIDSGALTKFRENSGHRKLAQDLAGLSSFVHERWADIQGKCLITLESMDEATRLGDAIMQLVGDRERSPASSAHATLQRDKAYTLFVRAYDEARRAVLFLRWHEEDADSILPSLYKGSRKAKKDPAPVVTQPATPVVPAAPAKTSSLLVAEEEV